jgi:DNA-binding NarL/FixJ family response regulator
MIFTISLFTDIDYLKKPDQFTWKWYGDKYGKFPVEDIRKKYLPSYFTKRESEIIRLFSKGLSGAQIAANLNISLSTVILHRKDMLKKANAKNTAGLVKYAVENGIL